VHVMMVSVSKGLSVVVKVAADRHGRGTRHKRKSLRQKLAIEPRASHRRARLIFIQFVTPSETRDVHARCSSTPRISSRTVVAEGWGLTTFRSIVPAHFRPASQQPRARSGAGTSSPLTSPSRWAAPEREMAETNFWQLSDVKF
jgi:hypothetical protein